MRRSQILVLVMTLLFPSLSFSQPKIPKENIPKDIPSEVRQNIERLYSEYATTRAEAARNLKGKDGRTISAIPFLIGLLDDETPLVLVVRDNFTSGGAMELPTSPAKEAGWTLECINDQSAIDPLVSVLKGGNEISQKNAAYVLGRMDHPGVVEPLTACLKDERPTVRKYAALALELRDEESRLKVIKNLKNEKTDSNVEFAISTALNDDDWEVRSEAIRWLGKNKVERAVTPLISIFNDKSLHGSGAWVIGAAVEALGEIGDQRATDPIIAILNNNNESIKTYSRLNAVKALGKLKDKRAVEPLLKVIKNSTPWDGPLCDFAIMSLGKIGDPLAVEPLIAILKKKDGHESSAEHALGEINDKRAIGPIINYMKDRDPQWRYATAMTLRRMTGMDLGDDPEKWQAWWDKEKK